MLYLKIINIETGEFRHTVLSPESNPQSECLIGRSSTCDLMLNSPDVSRFHAKIIFQNQQYLLNDLHSTDGLRINNQEVNLNEDRVLREEDAISIGSFILWIEKVEAGLALKAPAKSPQVLRCVRIVEEAIDTKTFSFLLEPAIAFPYQPGQVLPISVKSEDQIFTYFCPISSSPTRPLLDVTLKQTFGTDIAKSSINRLANWFFESMQVGNELIDFTKPSGSFTCFPHPPQKILLTSAGIGIASMMSMLRWIYDTAADCDVTLLHSTRSPDHIPFKQELELMAMHLPKFRLVITTTQPQLTSSWLGLTGRITADLLTTVVPDLDERTVYVAGAPDFVRSIEQILKQLHFPPQNYHKETFEAQSLIQQLSDRELAERYRTL
ncbi:FHA domain-containing protein [Microcoleus sp. FACHB-1515]|uniref:FHA domain-containing protein n=1 Tax=Cyanophyceae TaxID=3028117 RepID=UPI0016831BC3|nr:FHA domain-containing protein [Microcoleus sp. FACHB-1515]MBD2092706.1 FHA domain-containing protein [Microcoleus sp. FACHB-1515]